MAQRGKRMLSALIDAKGCNDIVGREYTGKRQLVVMYGVGLQERFAVMRRHLKSGGHVACWDLGYWDRDESMRVSIDGLHPTSEQIALAPSAGSRGEPELSDVEDCNGPVLLVGMGPKSVHMYGLRPYEWEKKAARMIAQKLPGRRILWRPKGRDSTPLVGTTLSATISIEHALSGCSLVVCRHSNVAVDACAAGVPVWCEGGAAAALYTGNERPTWEQRAEFLRRLGWWQWKPSEAAEAWAWIRKASGCD